MSHPPTRPPANAPLRRLLGRPYLPDRSFPISSAALAFLVSFAATAQRHPDGGQEARIDAATQAIQTNPGDSDAYVTRAVYYMEPTAGGGKPPLRHMKFAVADMDKAIELNPRSYFARHNYAHAAYLLGYPDLAISEFSMAITLNPSAARSFLGRAWACFESCLLDDATADFTRTLRLDPSLRAKVARRQDMTRRKDQCAILLRIGCKGVPLNRVKRKYECGATAYAIAHPRPPGGAPDLYYFYQRQEAHELAAQADARGDHEAARIIREGIH